VPYIGRQGKELPRTKGHAYLERLWIKNYRIFCYERGKEG
jgi:hypothetical protein